jgi:hypothetical protein
MKEKSFKRNVWGFFALKGEVLILHN